MYFLTSCTLNLIYLEYPLTPTSLDHPLEVVVYFHCSWPSNWYRHMQTSGVYSIRIVAGSILKYAVCFYVSNHSLSIFDCSERHPMRLTPTSLQLCCGNGYPSDFSRFDDVRFPSHRLFHRAESFQEGQQELEQEETFTVE